MQLYPYQEEVSKGGQKILNKYNMLYLALSPRYGKTPIVLDILQETNPKAKVLFITTKSAIDGIHDVVEGFDFRLDLTIINYESVHKLDEKFDVIVLDESHKHISKYPKPSKRWLAIESLVNSKTKVIWLSGTPSIESSSKLFHQLSLSPYHSFSKYKNFYHWFNGSAHYKTIKSTLPGYGVLGLTKYTGGPRPSIDYDYTVDFSSKFEPMMIRRTLEDSHLTYTEPNVIVRYTEMSKVLSHAYSQMKHHKIVTIPGWTATANNGAAKLSKLQQIAGGTIIADDSSYIKISIKKAQEIRNNHRDELVAVFYKYIAEYEILKEYFLEDNLYQIDSQNTGLDLSHYDAMVIYSLTFSGSNWSQVLSRMINSERSEQPKVYVYLTKDTVDEDIFRSVSQKKDANESFLRATDTIKDH